MPQKKSAQGLQTDRGINFLKSIKEDITSLFPRSNRKVLEDQLIPTAVSQEDWSEKERNIHRTLVNHKPATVLDLGTGSGWYAKLAAILGSNVVALDADLSKVDQLYDLARRKGLTILPLFMDFTRPTPSLGYSSHFWMAATDRLQCDMVLALSFIHHVVFERFLKFDQVVEGLNLFSKRWLIVEFFAAEDSEVEEYGSTPSWYTLSDFRCALEKAFPIITTMPSDRNSRILLFCEK